MRIEEARQFSNLPFGVKSHVGIVGPNPRLFGYTKDFSDQKQVGRLKSFLKIKELLVDSCTASSKLSENLTNCCICLAFVLRIAVF